MHAYQQPPDNSQSIAASLTAFDTLDILKRACSLQLLSRNAQCLFRLEVLSELAASQPVALDRPKMSAGRFRRLVQSGVGVAWSEDPFTWPMVESITFVGGDYLVLPGPTEGIRPGVDILLAAAVLDSRLSERTDFLNAIIHPCQALLTLIDSVCKSAGLARGEAPGPGKTVFVPSRDQMESLSRSITFANQDLESLFEATNLSPSCLRPFEMPPGVPISSGFEPGYGPLLRRPLIRHNGSLIVAMPHEILTALTRFVLDTAHEHGILHELSVAFHDEAIYRTKRCARQLGSIAIAGEYQLESRLPYTHEEFRSFDTDKLFHVMVTTDDFSNYSPENPAGLALLPDGERIDERMRHGLQNAVALDLSESEVLGLYVHVGVGRHGSMGFKGGSPQQEVLPLHLGELEALAYLECGNRLYLWHFADARKRTRESTETIAISLADELYTYRERDSSFYLADEATPNLLCFQPNQGGALRLEAYTRFDPHGISNGRDGYTECIRMYPDSSLPIYHPVRPAAGQPSQCVEVDGGVLWVWGQQPESEEEKVAAEMMPLLVDAMAFWLGRMAGEEFVVAAATAGITIQIHTVSASSWKLPQTRPEGKPVDPGVSVELDGSVMHAKFPPATMHLIAGSSGLEEFELLLPVFRELAAAVGRCKESAASAAAAKIRSPRHRKIVPMFSDETVSAIARPLPDDHLVPAAAEQRILDELSAVLKETGISNGPIRAEERCDVLNSLVAHLFKVMESEISELDGPTTLAWLVAHNEALIDRYSKLQINEPFYLACFETDAGPPSEFAKRVFGLFKADRACRFLIEYIAARPPTGSRRISYSVHDRLLALASKIVFFGTTSDDVKYRTDDPSLAVLGSGRIGISGSRRDETQAQWIDSFGRGQRARLLRDDEPESDSDLRGSFRKASEGILSASVKEFGFSLLEHWRLIDVALEEGVRQGKALTTMPIMELVAKIATELSVDERTARAWLESMSLGPREDFFTVPKPATKTDVFPWRLNRSWSYTHRPFLISGNRVIYGCSHLERSRRHLQHLCSSGRLKAKSKEMREAIGRLTTLNGHRFNRAVAQLFRSRADLVVRERIEKFGELRITSNGNTLGDIDVLVADPRRRVLRAYECKDLSVARTPPEIRNEIAKLVEGEGSFAAKHSRRVNWLREHLGAVLEALRIPADGQWDLAGSIIVDEELMSPLLVDLGMPILSLAEVEEMVASGSALR